MRDGRSARLCSSSLLLPLMGGATGLSPGSPNAALSTAGRIGATAASGRHPVGRAASGACAVAATRVRASQARRAPSRPRSLDGLQDHRSTGHPQGARHPPKGRQDCQVGDNALRRLHQGWLDEAERQHLLLCKIPLSRTTTTTTVLLRCDRQEVWDWTWVVRTARERALLHTVGKVREEHGTLWVWEEPVPMRVHREEAVLPKRQS